MNQTLIGAIVGAGAAIIGALIAGILGEYFKYHLYFKKDNREELKHTYEQAKKVIYLLKNTQSVDDNLIMELKVKLSIFASKETEELFNNICQNVNNDDSEKYINLLSIKIKKDLKIKDTDNKIG